VQLFRASPSRRIRNAPREHVAKFSSDVSSTPSEFADLIGAAARARAALGTGEKTCLPAERPNLVASRRSLCAARHLGPGTILGEGDLIALRPALGVTPDRHADLVGMRLLREMTTGTAFVEADVEWLNEGADRVA
jgi:sialic acid synthase SpsE